MIEALSTHLAPMTTYDENPLATVTVSDLRIDVWYAGDHRDEDGGTRRTYAYRIDDNDRTHKPVERADLASGVGADIDVHEALSTLITFMTAAGEGYRHVIAHPDSDPESMRLFPIWVCEAAYMNSDELAILTLDSGDVVPDAERRAVHATSAEEVRVSKREAPNPGGPML